MFDLTVDLEKLDTEIAQLKEIESQAKELETKAKSLRESILLQMQVLNQEKLETEYGQFSRRYRTNLKVDLKPEKLPPQYQSITANKDAIKAALQSGQTISGCDLEINEYLAIKWQ